MTRQENSDLRGDSGPETAARNSIPHDPNSAVQNYRRKGSKWPVFEKRQHTSAIEVTEAEPICRPPGPGEVDLSNGTRERHSSFHDGRFYANAPADFDRWDE